MKKSLVVIGILILVVLCEIAALWYKSKNPEPTEFALAEREYNLPAENSVAEANAAESGKIAPLVFETDFVEKTDVMLQELEDEADGGFAVHLTHVFNRMAQAEQAEETARLEKKKKLDEFRQTMAAEPVAVRGTYVGDNVCEVDGVRGICANGVYKLGKHCIACYEGICAGTTCAEEVAKAETEEAVVIYSEDTAENSAEDALQPVAEVAAEAKDESFINEVLGENIELPAAETTTPAEEVKAVEMPTPAEEVKPKEEIKPVEDVKPVETVKPEEKIATEKKSEPAVSPQNGEVLIAVVIDDIGLSVPFTNQMATIGQPVTVSFLPYGASNKEQVNKLRNAGLEVMLHAPMMPRVPADLAPVTLSPKMSKAEIQEKFKKMLERFEGTGMHGVNNHMGSAFTEDKAAMAAVMEVLQERGMYFLDSKTTSRSVGRAVSKEYGVPYVARDIFLDNERRYDYIMGQFKATERAARSKGYAIAIGHPYQQTLQALKDWLKDVEKRGIKIVPLSDLVAKTN